MPRTWQPRGRRTSAFLVAAAGRCRAKLTLRMDFSTFKLNNLPWLHALWGVALLGALVVWSFRRRAALLRRFASEQLLEGLIPDVSVGRKIARAAMALAAMAAIVFGLIDPRWGEYYEDVRRRGIDIVFCLDVSRSMLAEDVKPNRLDRAKQNIRDVLEVLGGDRVGLVTFAGTAQVKCPLTINYGAFRMTLDEVGPRSSPRGGTLIGDAIRQATEAFVDQLRGYKAIIVFTDGEDMESYPVEAARQAYEERGIRTYTIGLGDDSQGQRIPISQEGERRYLQHDGQEVWSRMSPATLQQTALAGGGAYVPAGTRQLDMAQFFGQKISTADQREFEATRLRQHYPRYAWPAAAALILLAAECLISERRTADGSSQ